MLRVLLDCSPNRIAVECAIFSLGQLWATCMKLISNKTRSRVNALGIFGYIIYKLGKIARLKRVYHRRHGRWFVYRPLKSDLEVIVSVHNGEFEAVPLPKSSGSKASLIVDAGGHIGMSAVFFATSWPNYTVAVIEPDYENYCMLQENVAPYDNIIPIHAALVPEKLAGDMVELFDRGTGPWGYSIVRQADSSAPRTFVPSVSLESILKGLPNFETIALLKLDIEGA